MLTYLLEIKAAGYDCVLFGQQSYNGVAILSRAVCASAQRGYPEDDATSHSRLLAAEIAGIRIVNVYVPNGQVVGSEKFQFKLKWMQRLRELFDLLGLDCARLRLRPEQVPYSG